MELTFSNVYLAAQEGDKMNVADKYILATLHVLQQTTQTGRESLQVLLSQLPRGVDLEV